MDAPGQYLPRHLQTAMDAALGDTPVVCLLGPRQCGKSTLARKQAPDRAYLSLDLANVRQTAMADPDGFVARLPSRVTIDEIQRAPELLLAIKQSVDEHRRPGRFLLTGSANLLQLPRLADSLAGRMECLFLHPLTEAEKSRTDGGFLARLLGGDWNDHRIAEDPPWDDRLPSRICAGGYPEPNLRLQGRARQWHRQYLQSVIERDIPDAGKVRDAREVARLLAFLAHQTGQLLNSSAVSIALQLDRQTVERYLALLERLFLISRLPAWHRNPANRLVKSPKLHFVDTGLAATLAGLQPPDWNTRRDRFGHLLESFVLQQLVALGGATDPDLQFWHYRDKDKVEVDVVMTRGDAVWGIEIKASATIQPGDSKGLRRLAELAGRDFQQGIVLYDGPHVLPIEGNRILAIPLAKLWEA